MNTENQGAPQGDVDIKTPAPTEGDKSQAQADTKASDTATEGESEDGTTPTDEGEPERKKRADGGFQRRISRLTADFRAAEAKAAAAEQRARELESKLTQPVKDADAPKRPRLESFNSYEDYEAADRAWVADTTRRETLKTLEEARSKEAEAKTATEQRERISKARERFESEAEKVADSYEDFDEVMDDFFRGRSPLKDFDRQAHEFIFEDAKTAPALVYHLHKNEDVARRIAGMRPVQQVAELARLEASLAKPGAKSVTKAPPPPRTVGAKGGPDGKDPEKMSSAELSQLMGSSKRVNI